MKAARLLPSAVLAALLASGCDRKSEETTKQIAELERKANEAAERQKELEQQIEDRRLAAERDAIERERMQIEEARADLQERQDSAAAAEAEKLRQREESLANREGKLERLQSTLEDKQSDLQQRDTELDARDRELAGREAVSSGDDYETDRGDTPVADYGTFHEALSPYGSWFETPDYGYVWQPVVVRDLSWRPYTRGRWVCTDRGWTWISDEPFGWATYHYGRWALCRGYGWIWVPGSEWAPAWVSWRHGATHTGWAPLPPETLAFSGGRCDSTVDVTFGIGAAWFNFVETRNFGSPVFHRCLPYTQNNLYFGQTINITNIYVHNRRVICGGPRYSDVQRQSDRRPPYYRIEEDRGRPGRDLFAMRPLVEGNRLRVAAPNMDAAWNEGLKPGKIKGRIESVRIERQEELRPEIADRFRQSREERRGKAEQTIARLGGAEQFNLRRMEQLETNRRQVEEQSRQTAKARDDRDRKDLSAAANGNIRPLTPPPPKDQRKRTEDNTDLPRREPGDTARQEDRRGEAGRNDQRPGLPDSNRRIFPPAREIRRDDTAGQNRREEDRRGQEQSRDRDNGPRVTPPADNNNQLRDEVARLRRQQEDQARQQQQMEENRREQARRQKQEENAREQARQQKQEESLREQARQQKQDENRRDQERRQQMEENRREQERRQQVEESRREQERRQQVEENRREQARQQQQEENRREQERRQQMEESRREQARQQQQEENRREQERRQAEENRREQARQQQQQEESRREQARQQQQQEESRREQSRQQEQQRQRDNDERQRRGH